MALRKLSIHWCYREFSTTIHPERDPGERLFGSVRHRAFFFHASLGEFVDVDNHTM